jgi:hypothetical protein
MKTLSHEKLYHCYAKRTDQEPSAPLLVNLLESGSSNKSPQDKTSDAKRGTIVPFWYISPLLVQFSTITQNMVHFTKLWYNVVQLIIFVSMFVFFHLKIFYFTLICSA